MRFRAPALGFGFLFVLGTVSFAEPVHAQPAPPKEYPTCKGPVSTSDSEAAHTKYLAGKVDYDEAKYDSAISRFVNAYTLDCTKHELLVIISRAYEQSGNKAEAIRALEVYLERAPANTPDASNYRNRLDNLRKALADERSRSTAATPPVGPSSAASSAGSSSGSSAPVEIREHTVYPWILVGAGTAAMVVGGALHLARPSLPDNCDADKGTCERLTGQSETAFQDDQETAGRWRSWPNIGTAFLIGGGVAVAGGLLWHFLEPTGPVTDASASAAKKKRPVALLPALAPGYGGVALGGRF